MDVCATTESGGQCVNMAGMKWMLMLSACSQLGYGFLYRCTSKQLVNRGRSNTIFDNVTCNKNHSELFQRVDIQTIGLHNCDQDNTAACME